MTGRHLSAALKVAANQNIKDRDYWLNRLAGEIEKSYFPYDKESTGQAEQTRLSLANVSFGFPGEMAARLLQLTRQSDYVLHIYLAAGVVLLLHYYTGKEDILVATPIYKQDIEGEFINRTILLRNRLRDNMTVKELLIDVKQTITEAVKHQNYPLEMLPEQLNLSNDKEHSGFPLFDTAILLENLQDKKYLAQINHNMQFSFSRNDSTLKGKIEYNTQLYEKSTVERIGRHFILLMEQALDNLDSCISRLEALPGEERQKNIKWLSKKKKREVLIPPRGPYQEKLAEIWSEILKVEKERIGIDTNFFKLGGHSLKASRLVMRIHQEFNIRIPLTTVFAAPFIRTLAREIAEAKEKSVTGVHGTGKYTPLETEEKKEYYALSSAQARLFILEQQGEISAAYNIRNALKLKGPLKAQDLEKAFRTLVNRHESLRTSFHWINGEPVQRVTEKPVFKVESYDISQPGNKKSQKDLEPVLKDFLRPFKPDRAPLFRVGLVKLHSSGNEHILLVDMHHIISDGISMGILVREFAGLYKGEDLQPLRTQYKDFTQWEHQFFETPPFNQQAKFWKESLNGQLPRLPMPIDFKRPEKQSFAGSEITFTISTRQKEQLNILAEENNVTLNILLLSIYILLLHKYTHQEDIIVGTLVSGRNHPDLEHMIGMFGNFLPIRNRVEPGQSFSKYLAAARERIAAVYGNQDYPFEKIIDLLQVPIDRSRNPIFDTMLIFHNELELSSRPGIPGLDAELYPLARTASTLDFKLDIYPGADAGGNLKFSLEYNTGLYKKQTMQRLIKHFKQLIRQVTAHPERKISHIEIFTAGEKRNSAAPNQPVRLAVSATFTSEPMQEYIVWWGKQFGLDIEIVFAPYNQVFQQLLEENSLLSANASTGTRGINLLLIRFEDWIRELNLDDESKCAKLEKNFRELERITRQKQISAPYLVGLFPASTHLSMSPRLAGYLEDLDRRWKKLVEETANFYLLDFTSLGQRYQIGEIFDPVMDKEGHLPFTHEFYAAVGTHTARTICTLVTPPFKVIVLDCDNTLWQGICGEDGPLGVKVASPYREMQRLMLQKHDQGMLLTLCSKNNPTDVWDVFEKNPGMLLTRDHFVDWKINWQPKSKNIKELAAQLNLGVESFIFIDDSAVECAEVITNCPGVLTLRLPANPRHIPFFLEHVWALDKMVVTREDKERTRMYRTDKIRKEIREQAPSLAEFLSQLELKVSFNIMKSSQVDRVTQLTQRTNQFNLSTRRRQEDEIIALAETSGVCCWVLEVSDRFGDYGLVGVVITLERNDHLFIDTLLLSCRVLGRGVEDAILTCLKKYLQECGLTVIKADYYPTPKNTPILEFLQRTWKLEEQAGNYTTYSLKGEAIPSITAFAEIYYQTTLPKPAQPHRERDNHREISLDHISAAVLDQEPGDEEPMKSLPALDLEVYGQDREDWQHRPHLLPLQYCTAGKLLQLPTYQVEKIRFSMGEDEEPQNELQRKLAQIWQDILKREKIGINMSFFAAGGNSLKAILMVSKIGKELNVQLTLKEVFDHPTIKKLAQYITGHTEKTGFSSIEPVEKQEYYVLSSAQQRLYFLQQMDKDGTAYNIFSNMIMEGIVDKDKLERSIRGLIQGHESLRTSIEIIEEEPVQRIHEHVEFEIEYKEVEVKAKVEEEEAPFGRDLNASGGKYPKSQELRAKSYISSFIRPFDLTRAPLLRVGLIKLEEEKHIFLVDMHHIISDGMSFQVLVRDFSALYVGKELTGIKLQYKDYTQWQNRERGSKEILAQGEYWKKEYEGEIPVLELPTDYARPKVQGFEGNSINFEINKETSGAIKALVQETQTTLYIVLLAFYTILISKLSSQEDIIIGTPVLGRRHADLEKIIGMFVNTLALRNYPFGEKKFTGFLGEVKERTLKSLENQVYPYEEFVEKVAVKRDVSHNPLFDTLFVVQDAGTQKIEIPDLKLVPYEYENKTSKFDLSLTVLEVEERLLFTFEYSTKLFKRETIKRFIVYFKNIVKSIIENKNQRIFDIEIITEEERRRVLFDFNDTYVEYPKDKTIHQLFEEQVEQKPDQVALVGVHQTHEKHKKEYNRSNKSYMSYISYMSYKELNEKAHQLAHFLQEKGVQPDNIVGIMVERSVEMIIGIMAILKADGAYLPIEMGYPQERIDYMLKDSDAKILLTGQVIAGFSSPQALYLSEGHNFTNDQCPMTNDQLAYVIYTSGSTGKPKGVLVEHGNVVSLVKNVHFIDAVPGDRLLLTGAIVFDITTFEVWYPLLNGLVLYLAEQEVILNPEKLGKFLEKNRITILHLIPQLFNVLVGQRPDIFKGLRHFLVGGDLVQPNPINRLRSEYPRINIIHCYGPTENTTFSTTLTVERDYPERLPIGRPIQNSSVYIIGQHGSLQPIGVPGELVTGGEGVTRGYINQPELTFERFTNYKLQITNKEMPSEHPMQSCNHAIMQSCIQASRQYHPLPPHYPITPLPHHPIYLTGDLARWHPDGNIEFQGRIDYQVKIRGFRIEMGEIESQLIKHQDIKEAVVLDQTYENENRYLCAYITAERDLPLTEIKGYLQDRLPGYMIPSEFVMLEKMPLTNSGKLDRQKLKSVGKRLSTEVEHVAPQSDNEVIIAKAWKNVLKLEEVGIYDNFFDMGGTSLDMIRLNSKLTGILKREIPIIAMYRYTTIDSFARFLEGGSGETENKPAGTRSQARVDRIKKGMEDKNKRREIRSRRNK